MNKILITGGAGFIGSTLANFYSDTYQVIILDDLSMGKKENIHEHENVTFIQGSVTDKKLMDEIFSANQFDYIFHLAAIASVADSVERPVETHVVNFQSVLHLLELIRKKQKNLKRMVFSSSAAVYGDEKTLPKHEESVIRPLTPYAIDKFAAEKYVVSYYHLYGVPASAVRFFNVYGPKQNPSSPYSGVISILMDCYQRKLAGDNTASFSIFGDGEQSRDFVYIEDVVQALHLIATSTDALGEVYNVGTGQATSLNDLVIILNKFFSVDLPVVYKEERTGDIKHSLATIEKIKKIGFHPNISVEEGLQKYVMNEINKKV